MLFDELNEANVKLLAFSQLLWHYDPSVGTADDFFWGLGMIAFDIVKDIEAIKEKLEKELV